MDSIIWFCCCLNLLPCRDNCFTRFCLSDLLCYRLFQLIVNVCCYDLLQFVPVKNKLFPFVARVRSLLAVWPAGLAGFPPEAVPLTLVGEAEKLKTHGQVHPLEILLTIQT